MIRSLISLLFFLGFSTAIAQELIFEKPDQLKKLPSNETYQIMQDSKGYIWFSTEAGLCRYNGQELKIFRGKEGIPEEACYGMVQNSKGDIYVVTSKNRILKLENEKFVEIPASIQFVKDITKLSPFVNTVKTSGDSLLLISTRSKGFKVNLKNNTVNSYSSESTTIDIDILNVYGLFLPVSTFNPDFINLKKSVYTYEANKGTLGIRFSRNEQNTAHFIPTPSRMDVKGRVLVAKDTSGSPIVVTLNILIRLQKDGSVTDTTIREHIICLYRDKNNGLWLGTRSHGLLYYSNAGNIHSQSIGALDGNSVAGITEDEAGNIWCTTLENGIFCCRNKAIRRVYENTYEKNKGPFFNKCLQDTIFVFTGNGPVLRSFNNKLDTLGIIESNEYIKDVLVSGNEWITTGKHMTRRFSYDLKKTQAVFAKDHPKMSSVANQLLLLNNGKIFSIYYNGFIEIKGDELIRHHLETGGPKLGLAADLENNLYLYTSEKIFNVNYSDPTDITCSEFASFPNMRKVIIDTKNRFWILTKGAYIYTLKNEKKDSILISSKKGQMQYFDIYEDPFSNMWLATNSGVLKLSQAKWGYKQEWFDENFGLPNVEYDKITGTLNDIVVTTSTSVYKFPLNSRLKRLARVPVYISSVKVNNKPISVSDNRLTLDYDENTVDVNYDVLNYSTLSDVVRLAYKVIGYDESFHYLDNDDILLTKLPPGDFQLRVSAVDDKGNPISDINTLYIKVNPPFWQTWPFIVLTALCGFALTIYIIFLFARRGRKKLEEKNRIDKMLTEYQMSALKAQMNPHFIFNCINSIQRYILTNKTSDAYDYLAKFSKLIRLVLNYSEDTMITLEEELEIAQLYIEMEQIRYEGFFTYEIVCAEDVPMGTVYLPSLLLQPYIENAIWHGIMNLQKSREGLLKVYIYMQGEDLSITIEDNGVGREEAGKMRNQNHESKALGLNKKRMELINLMNNSVSASVILEDILYRENTVQGTIVKITIPQIHPNE